MESAVCHCCTKSFLWMHRNDNKVRSGFLLLGILLRNVICKKWIMFYKLITCFACKR